MTPTERTLRYLREQGYTVEVVERWNPYAKIRQDLLGIFDILALDPKRREIVGVQCTSGGNVSARVKKIKASDKATVWTRSGGLIWVIGWSLKGKKGERKTWQPRVVEVRP